MSSISNTGSLPFEFRDPPSVHRGQATPVGGQLALLRDFPDQWAMIGSFEANSTAHSVARRINRGQYGEGYEAQARKVDDGSTEVFVRFIGIPPKPAWAV